MNYKNWLNEWLTYYVKPTTKERTYKKYLRQIENYIIPQLGEYEVDNLSAYLLQKFTVELSENGLAANTVNGIISVLKSSLKRAVVLGITQAQFADAIVRPKIREKQVESFSKEEQRKIEQYISDSKKDKLFGIIFCLYTGLSLIAKYNIKNEMYIKQLKKHAGNLFFANIEPLYSISECPCNYYTEYFDLVLSTYFFDSVIDHDEIEEKQFTILSLFIGIDLFCNFKQWFTKEFEKDDIKEFDKYFNTQLEYQLIERKDNYKSFCQTFKNYKNHYWLKQGILLYPLIAFCKRGYFDCTVEQLKAIYQKYYTILLQIDDYMDIKNDLNLDILTPLQSIFYAQNGFFASTKRELLEIKPEIEPFDDLPIAFQKNLIHMLNKLLSS